MASMDSVPIGKLMNNVTCEITLTGIKTWKMRFWVGIIFFKLGVWVIGMKGNVKLGNAILGEIK
jgi:hypothetical protein